MDTAKCIVVLMNIQAVITHTNRKLKMSITRTREAREYLDKREIELMRGLKQNLRPEQHHEPWDQNTLISETVAVTQISPGSWIATLQTEQSHTYRSAAP
jgi:hypothetical protein